MQADSSDGVAKFSTKLSSLLTQKPLWTLGSFTKTLFHNLFTQGKVGVANGKVAVGCDGRRLFLKTLSLIPPSRLMVLNSYSEVLHALLRGNLGPNILRWIFCSQGLNNSYSSQFAHVLLLFLFAIPYIPKISPSMYKPLQI